MLNPVTLFNMLIMAFLVFTYYRCSKIEESNKMYTDDEDTQINFCPPEVIDYNIIKHFIPKWADELQDFGIKRVNGKLKFVPTRLVFWP